MNRLSFWIYFFGFIFQISVLYGAQLKHTEMKPNIMTSLEERIEWLSLSFSLVEPILLEPIDQSSSIDTDALCKLWNTTQLNLLIQEKDSCWKYQYLRLLSLLDREVLQINKTSSSVEAITQVKASNEIKQQYKKRDSAYEKAIKYNLVIIVQDLGLSMDKDERSYAKIYIDRRFFGETNQALKSQKKVWTTFVNPDEKHLLFVEKFVYNSFKKEWERLVNLYQPRKKYIVVPKDRIQIIEIIYNPKMETPQMSHLKYQYKMRFMKKNEESIFEQSIFKKS